MLFKHRIEIYPHIINTLIIRAIIVLIVVLVSVVPLVAQSIEYVAGLGIGDENRAQYAPIIPGSLHLDGQGNLYFGDLGNKRIRYISLHDSIIHSLAQHIPPCEEDGLDEEFCLDNPRGLTFSTDQSLYISDLDQGRVLRYTFSTQSFEQIYPPVHQEGRGANQPRVLDLTPYGMDMLGEEELFICDTPNHRVVLYDLGLKQLERVAGIGKKGFSGDGGPAHLAKMNTPTEVLAWEENKLLILDGGNHCIRVLDLETGIIETLAGKCRESAYSPEPSSLKNARFNSPEGMGMDTSGNIYVADEWNHVVRKIDFSSGQISTVAGNHVPGYSGDQGLATQAQLNRPQDVAVDQEGNLYISDFGNEVIRKVDAQSQNIYTLAGTGKQFFCQDTTSLSDACFKSNSFLAFAPNGDLWISDSENHRICRLDFRRGNFIPSIGRGVYHPNPQEPSVFLNNPKGIAFDQAGNLFIADSYNSRILFWDPNRKSSLILLGEEGFISQDIQGTPVSELLKRPFDLIFEDSKLYISDEETHQLLILDLTNRTLVSLNNPDNLALPEDKTQNLYGPMGIALDSNFVYVADAGNERVVRLSLLSGELEPVIGGGLQEASQDFIPAQDLKLYTPFDICPDGQGNFYLSDSESSSLFLYNASQNIIKSLNEPETPSSLSLNQSLVHSELNQPKGMVVNADGDLYLSETNLIRKVNQIDDVLIGGPDSACIGEPYSYYNTFNQDYEFYWDIKGGEILNSPQEPSVIVNWLSDSPEYTLTLQVENVNGLQTTIQRNIYVIPDDISYGVPLPRNEICLDEPPMPFPVLDEPGAYYINDQEVAFFDPLAWDPGRWYLIYYQTRNDRFCTRVFVDSLYLIPENIGQHITIFVPRPYFCPGSSRMTLQVLGDTQFDNEIKWDWFQAGKTEPIAVNRKTVEISEAGTYWADLSEASCQVWLISPIYIGELQVFVPELFTPNGDQANDRLTVCVNYPEDVEQIQFEVFHPDGQRVFASRDKDAVLCQENPQNELGWDGNNQASGLYLWKLYLSTKSCGTISRSGKVYLKR